MTCSQWYVALETAHWDRPQLTYWGCVGGVSVCVCVVHVHECVGVYACGCTYRGQSRTLGVFHLSFPGLFPWDKISHWTRSWQFWLDWQASKLPGSPCLLALSAGAIGLWSHAWFFTCEMEIHTWVLMLVWQTLSQQHSVLSPHRTVFLLTVGWLSIIWVCGFIYLCAPENRCGIPNNFITNCLLGRHAI